MAAPPDTTLPITAITGGVVIEALEPENPVAFVREYR
jgi:hypothetical protein